VPAIVLASFYAVLSARPSEVEELAAAWVIPNAAFVAAFALFARAQLLTVLAAALAAPITALIPRLDAGMVAARVEATLRRPGVADCEGLSHVASLADWRKNRFTRVLIIGFTTTVGSTLGAIVGAIVVLTLL
jgi:pheromone shutdown protein TraB